MVSAVGHAPWLREDLELAQGVESRIDVRLEGGLPLAGRVVESDGTPVAGGHLTLEGERACERGYITDEPSTREYLFERARAFSDEDGRFRFEDLFSGRFTVRTFLPGETRLHADGVGFAGDEALEIVVDRAAIERVVLAGRVVDRGTGEPLRAFTITPMVWNGASEALGSGVPVADDPGRFRLAGLDPGRISLSIAAPGYATWTEEPRELEAGTQDYQARLARLRVIGLRLLDLAGGRVPIQREGMSTTQLELRDPWASATRPRCSSSAWSASKSARSRSTAPWSAARGTSTKRASAPRSKPTWMGGPTTIASRRRCASM
jgi:protocatechuate 3,4-dioxygenase beta subunit